MLPVDRTWDLSVRGQVDLAKALASSPDEVLRANIRQELAYRTLRDLPRRRLISQTCDQIAKGRVGRDAAMGEIARLMYAVGALDPDLDVRRVDLAKAAKASKDLTAMSAEDLVSQALSGSNSDRSAALMELGRRALAANAASIGGQRPAPAAQPAQQPAQPAAKQPAAVQ